MNVWILSGNLGADAETKFLSTGNSVTEFRLAGKYGYGDKAQTFWVRCAIWGERGEKLAQYLTKGSAVTVQGEVNVREYDDKDGNKRTSVELNVREVILPARPKGEPSQHDIDKGNGYQRQEEPPIDDDIPF